MKYLLFFLSVIFLFAFSSCASIYGGPKYNAKVLVEDFPNAKIKYKGDFGGTGEASFSISRKDADKVSFTIEQDGCKTEIKNFNTKTFRGGAFVGTILLFTGIKVNNKFYAIPFGVIWDVLVGSLWKPDISTKGVSKQDYDNYVYHIRYTGCKEKSFDENISNKGSDEILVKKKLSVEELAKGLKELNNLYKEGLISKKEYIEQREILFENQ